MENIVFVVHNPMSIPATANQKLIISWEIEI